MEWEGQGLNPMWSQFLTCFIFPNSTTFSACVESWTIGWKWRKFPLSNTLLIHPLSQSSKFIQFFSGSTPLFTLTKEVDRWKTKLHSLHKIWTSLLFKREILPNKFKIMLIFGVFNLQKSGKKNVKSLNCNIFFQ